MIDNKMHAEMQRLILTLQLGSLYPQLVNAFAALQPGTNSILDEALWPRITGALGEILRDYDTQGLIKLPAAALPKGFPVAYQQGTEDIASINNAGNALLAGPSGSGKTTLLHQTLRAAYLQGYQLYLHDPKEDAAMWPTLVPSMRTIDGTTAINLIACPPWRTIPIHILELIELFRTAFYCGEQQLGILRKALEQAFAAQPEPSLEDVHKIIDGMITPKATYAYLDAVRWLGERFHKIRLRYPVPYRTKRGEHSLAWFLQQHLYFPTLSQDPVAEWVTTLLLHHVFQRNKHYGIREITTVAAIDEGIGVLSKAHANANITGTNSLATLASMNREFGIRILFTTADLGQTDPLILNTVSTIAIMPGVRDEQSLRHIGFRPEQLNAARHLRLGQALLLYPGQLSWPLRISFPPLPAGMKEQRPRRETPPMITEPATLPIPKPITEPTTKQAVEPVKVALNTTDKALLAYLAKVVIDTVTNAYNAVGAHYSAGDASKTRLIQLGYVRADRIVVRSGRGGAAVSLTLTTAGYDYLGVKPPKRSRGGGPQAEYLIQHLHRSIVGSSLEVSLNGKAPDLIFRYDPSHHEAFLRTLQDDGVTFTGAPGNLAPETLVAIEVECSDPTKTMRNNLTKDKAAGLVLVVFAVMPKDLKTATQHLLSTGENLEGIIIIDALLLLSRLGEEASHA